jgi:type IV pilus assembly protein PilC
MPIYKWEGKTLKGSMKRGETEAPSEDALRIHLRQQSIIPIKISMKGKEVKLPSIFKPKVKSRMIAVFTRQLATMIDAGLPLVQSLDILSSQQEHKTFKNIIRGIKEDVE